jgi:hypothetical protein
MNSAWDLVSRGFLGLDMPPRWLSVAIVVSWLAATAWLIWRDLWPSWRPGEPPPFHIDLVEEVQKADKPPIFWHVRLDDQDVFRASTWVDYHSEEDTFAFHARYQARKGLNTRAYDVAGLFRVAGMSSEYRVNRAGELRSLRAEIEVSLKEPRERLPTALARFFPTKSPPPRPVMPGGLSARDPASEIRLALWGEVRDGQFFAHCQANAVWLDQLRQIDLPPTTVSHNGSVLLPLHPVNRIHGLRPGRTWRQPLVDPFRDAFAALPGFSGEPHAVLARVLPEPQPLQRSDNDTASCLVIEYEDEGEIVGRTWVEQDSERVLKQEAIIGRDHWSMTRDDFRSSTRPPLEHQHPLSAGRGL